MINIKEKRESLKKWYNNNNCFRCPCFKFSKPCFELSDEIVGRYYNLLVNLSKIYVQAYKDGYKTGYKDARQWHNPTDLPKEDKKYLAKYVDNNYYILNYAKNLFEIDNFVFYDKKNIPGFYVSDEDYGFVLVDSKKILGWTEICD